jgi:teichuronic acid biosynthesis glycosyltransferase TuaG
MSEPLVSVIMPTYNSQRYVKHSIDSVLSQSFKKFEMIIVDDCSKDQTMKVLKKYQKKDTRIRVFKTKINSGNANASVPRNLGIKYSKGDYCAFIDSDDIWNKDKLINQINQLSNDKLLSCTATDIQYGSKGLKSNFFLNLLRIILQLFFIGKINKKGYRWLYVYNPIWMSSVVIDKKVFNYFKFNENKNTREDLDFWLKFTHKFKNAIIYEKKILLTITRRKNSVTSQKVPELNRIISSITSDFIFKNKYDYYNFFIFGIILKLIKSFLITNYNFFSQNIKKLMLSIASIYFIVFYSPLFWYLGNKLLIYDPPKKVDNIVVFSGPGNTQYYNSEYIYRYKDIKNYLNYYPEVKNIYLLGRLREVPEQRLIESLLINDGVNRSKINVVYEEYNTTNKNIMNIYSILKDKNIKEVIFFTAPYHTKRAQFLWNKYSDLKVNMNKSIFWPRKNEFFERAKNKKIIIYEYLALIYNYFKK